MSKHKAIYAGFFDPFTLGHLNIVERAKPFFEDITIAIALDSPKTAMFSAEERLDMVREVLGEDQQVRVEGFTGLLVDFVVKSNARILIRGIRTVSDFEYEFQMALANKCMRSEIETFFMMTDSRYSYLSSTLIKEIARLGGPTEHMVPAIVAKKLERFYEAQ